MSGLTARTPVQGTTGKLSTKAQYVYDRMLLEQATPNEVFDRFGKAKVIPANSNTKKAFAYRYKGILPALTPIAEYDGSNIKAPNKIVREEVEYEVKHYGDYIVFTDELDLYDYRNIQSDFMEVLGEQASLTVDTIRRDALRGGSNVVFANGVADRASLASVITASDISLMAVKLKKQGAKKFHKIVSGSNKIGTTPIRSAYIGIVTPEVTEDLRALPNWKDVEAYGSNMGVMQDEVGSIGDFRIIESINNDPIIDGVTAGTDAYLSLFMGKDAYATTSLRGKGGIKSIVNAIGSAGAEDPLAQYGTIGWKAITGCAILNENWLIRCESIATMDVVIGDYLDRT